MVGPRWWARPVTPHAQPGKNTGTSSRIRAVLAGGITLGLGAVMTVAAWTNSEFVSGQFQLGQFNIQGSAADLTTPHNWVDHPSKLVAANFRFDGAAVQAVEPGTQYYAPFSLRVDPAAAGFAADISLDQVDTAGPAALLSESSWGARLVASKNDCSAMTFVASADIVVPTGTRLPDGAPTFSQPVTSTNFRLDNTVTGGATPSTTVCFEISTDEQGTRDNNDISYGSGDASIQWLFTAESVVS